MRGLSNDTRTCLLNASTNDSQWPPTRKLKTRQPLSALKLLFRFAKARALPADVLGPLITPRDTCSVHLLVPVLGKFARHACGVLHI